ncbi:hypothetical protein S7S_07490 [Isoalcanivorax pacificus W11-5]|uniref:Tetratricopeptide repeat protein n=1 Tax=Isoalcanivorax pacificus W11-5 TaxID=391936 RepID=A0A0B4XIA1_9GAMM|nr:tetratricopeptide repeat protein [Isoalcanivorax pacificus]AJD47914.1 hypothetical protein S7S_07490 [Isoalcanivorax pacificus W11-5]
MRRLPRRLGAVALGVLMALTSASAQESSTRLVLFEDIPLGPLSLGLEEQRYLAFGEAIFDYYSDHQFAALSGLKVNQVRGLFDEHTEYAELLLGELFVNYGLPAQAEEIFDRLLKQDILSRTRAETWLHKADLHYRQGQYDAARDILESNRLRDLKPEQQPRRQLMLANILINQGEFRAATRELDAVDPNSLAGAYAGYNIGVAMIRADQTDAGLARLDRVAGLPPGDEEINALKDRAALAIGLTELQRQRFDQARAALLRIRADGPFSNEALMALGLANYERGAARAALPLWLELVRRNPAHESVQEAMLLAPRAYEDLGAQTQALAGYRFAAEQFRNALRDIEQAIRSVDEAGWLASLTPDQVDSRSSDPMAWLTRFGTARGAQVTYLHALFAERGFAENYRQYQQLVRLRDTLARHQRELPVLLATLSQRQHQLDGILPRIRAELVALRQQQQQLSDSTMLLAMGMPRQLDIDTPEDLAGLPQLIMWQRIDALLDSGRGSSRQRDRLARLRGLLLWDIANQAPEQRQRQEQDSAALRTDAELVGLRIAALEQLVRDASLALRSDLGARLNAQEQRIDRLLADADSAINDLGQVLKNDALRVLAQQRVRLGEHLAEAHLSAARLQDTSANSGRGDRP